MDRPAADDRGENQLRLRGPRHHDQRADSDLLVARGLPRSKATDHHERRGRGAVRVGRCPRPPRAERAVRDDVSRHADADLRARHRASRRSRSPSGHAWRGTVDPRVRPRADRARRLAKRAGSSPRSKSSARCRARRFPAGSSEATSACCRSAAIVFLDFAFPNKLPEYIMSGKAVIISRLSAIEHYFSERAVAYSSPTDVADLAAQMVRLYRDPTLRAALARRASEEYAPITLGRDESALPRADGPAVGRTAGRTCRTCRTGIGRLPRGCRLAPD